MTSKYLEMERGGPAADSFDAPAPRAGRYRDIEMPRDVVAPKPEEQKEFIDKIPGARTLDNIVRMLASGATVGGIERISGALPGGKGSYAEELAANKAFKKESPWLATGAEVVGGIVPGIGVAGGVAKTIPALGKATIPSMMGNAAVTGSYLSGVEDIIRGKIPDLTKLVTSGALGAAGAGVIGTGARLLSPGAKVRAAGSDLTSADKAGMKALAATGDRAGIPLRIPELASEVAPGRAARVEGLDNFMSRLRSGEVARRNFDQGRLPNIEAAVEKVRGVVGKPPETGLPAKEAAESAIDRANKLVQRSAKPSYDKSMDVTLPTRQDHPNILDVRKKLYGNKTIEPEIRNADPNSVRVLQHTADAIEAQIQNAKNPAEQALLIAQKRGLLDQLEKASPDFAMGQRIVAGGRGMVDEVKSGPLGTISSTTNPSTQASALLKAQPDAARKAIERLDPDSGIPRGILAGEVDRLAKDPVKFGRALAPTKESEGVIKQIVGDQDFDAIKDIITASRARTKAATPSGGENSDSPWSAAWDAMQNMSSRGVVNKMNDPKTIDKLGDPGVMQRLLQAFGLSAENQSMDSLLREPLIIDVKPKKRVREANAR